MIEDAPLTHTGMAAQFGLQKQYYAQRGVFTLQSSQPVCAENVLKRSYSCNFRAKLKVVTLVIGQLFEGLFSTPKCFRIKRFNRQEKAHELF